MSSEFTTLALLLYSLALVGVFALPTVRQRVPRIAVVLLVTVPWAAALFAGALTAASQTTSMRDSYLELDNLYPVSQREALRSNLTNWGYSTRDDANMAHRWNVLYRKFDELPCEARTGHAVGEVWIAPGDACFLAANAPTSTLGAKIKDTGICDDDVFAADYSLRSHFLVCLEMREYDYLRKSEHCYEAVDDDNMSLRLTDERLRSVCAGNFCSTFPGLCNIFGNCCPGHG
jgi:hypothetical protein